MGGWDTNNHDDLTKLAELYLDGKIKPVVHEVLQLEGLISGLKELELGVVLGKIVIKMES